MGPAPRSGGDTYNAVAAVDDYLFFGGWVHAPVEYAVELGRRRVLFRNKYSHVHRLDVGDLRVELLWKEGLGDESRWAGEVSDIIYDPVNDRLLLARGDGHGGLGVYELSTSGGRASRILDQPSLKGALVLDYACFDVIRDWRVGVEALQYLDLVDGRKGSLKLEFDKISADGYGVARPLPCTATSVYGRFMLFVKGGVLCGDPVSGEITFYRLMDFGWNMYSAYRCNALPYAGGVLIGFSAYSYGVLLPRTRDEEEESRSVDRIVAPSLLMFITPPAARPLLALGARITSLEHYGERILVGVNTAPNLATYSSTLVDPGFKDIVALRDAVLASPAPPLEITVKGFMVEDMCWGGIPVSWYREAMLVVKNPRDCVLHVHRYDLACGPGEAEHDSIDIRKERNTVDLKGPGIVSFKFEGLRSDATVKILLR